jgi:Ca2+/Na+ antiporter|tara:strand:+ start:3713 stop:4126 length:414 start_codon:yes stop_codon:yes gene_type:complete
MLKLNHFLHIIIFIILIILFVKITNYYHREYNIFIEDDKGNKQKVSSIFPNLDNKNVSVLTKMFKDINYCDNMDNLNHVTKNNKYYLEDDYDFYDNYKETFQNYENMFQENTYVMNVYFTMIGLFIILFLYKIIHNN